MLNKSKKATILILIVIFSLSTISREIPKTEGVDLFFSLVARGFNSRHMDYLILMKEQLARIGIFLDVKYFNLSEVSFPATLLAFRDFDMQIIEIPCSYLDDPFLSSFFTENGSENYCGYHTSLDWVDQLETGRNEWYIQTGLSMTPNDSQGRINLCWEWQHYMLDEILPCLPLFSQQNNHTFFDILIFNMHEARVVLGNRDPAIGKVNKTKGLAIRKAIAYAINRDEIRRIVLGDEYEVIHHPTNPILNEWLNPSSIQYCHNLRAAWGYMYAAGHNLGFYPCVNYEPKETLIIEAPWSDWESYCSNSTLSEPTEVNGNRINLAVIVPCFGTISYLAARLINRRKAKKG